MAYPEIHVWRYPTIAYHAVEWYGHYDWYDGPLDGLLKYSNEYYWYFICGGGANHADFAIARITTEQANQFLEYYEYSSAEERVIDDYYREFVENYHPPIIVEADVIGIVTEDWGKKEPIDFSWEKEGF